MKYKTKIVSITPIYKLKLDVLEEASLNQLCNVLGDLDKYFIHPVSLDLSYYAEKFGESFQFISFPDKYFTGTSSYNQLLRSEVLFEALSFSEYFLMHHTDAWVFEKGIENWLSTGYTYVGAPIYEYNQTLEGGHFLATGQGGLSIHHIPTALHVLRSWKVVYPFKDLLAWYAKYNWKGKLRFLPYFFVSIFGFNRLAKSGWNNCKINEDLWWGMYVPQVFKQCIVPTESEAAKFSMEFNCEALLKKNNNKLPFGTHQWFKPLFQEFWKQHIEILK